MFPLSFSPPFLRSACTLWQSPSVSSVMLRVEVEVESGRLLVRADRCPRRDVGLKKRLLELLLAYHPLWLRIGLETVFGELVNVQGTGDVVGISRYLQFFFKKGKFNKNIVAVCSLKQKNSFF